MLICLLEKYKYYYEVNTASIEQFPIFSLSNNKYALFTIIHVKVYK